MDFSDVAQCCKNYGEYIGKAGAGGRKRMAVFRHRPLRSEEAGQQTDRKYAAAAMRALVSLQMQGMPRAFEAFPPFFIWRSGARTFFQKSGEPFSHLFLCFFEHRSIHQIAAEGIGRALPLLFERRAGRTGEERVDLPFVFGGIHGAGDVGEVPAGRQVRPHGIEDAALEVDQPGYLPGVRSVRRSGCRASVPRPLHGTSSRMVLGVPRRAGSAAEAQNSGGALSTRRLASSLMPRSRGWYVSLAARTARPAQRARASCRRVRRRRPTRGLPSAGASSASRTSWLPAPCIDSLPCRR